MRDNTLGDKNVEKSAKQNRAVILCIKKSSRIPSQFFTKKTPSCNNFFCSYIIKLWGLPAAFLHLCHYSDIAHYDDQLTDFAAKV